jgi:hypothetical protein
MQLASEMGVRWKKRPKKAKKGRKRQTFTCIITGDQARRFLCFPVRGKKK